MEDAGVSADVDVELEGPTHPKIPKASFQGWLDHRLEEAKQGLQNMERDDNWFTALFSFVGKPRLKKQISHLEEIIRKTKRVPTWEKLEMDSAAGESSCSVVVSGRRLSLNFTGYRINEGLVDFVDMRFSGNIVIRLRDKHSDEATRTKVWKAIASFGIWNAVDAANDAAQRAKEEPIIQMLNDPTIAQYFVATKTSHQLLQHGVSWPHEPILSEGMSGHATD